MRSLFLSTPPPLYPSKRGDKWLFEWGVNICANVPSFRGFRRKTPYFWLLLGDLRG